MENVLQAVEQVTEQTDFSSVLSALDQIGSMQQASTVTNLILTGVVLGCTIALILAVMFR